MKFAAPIPLAAMLAFLLACSGAGVGPAFPEVQWGMRYYHDRDLQPGNGWDVDYAVWFDEDGGFRMSDEGLCVGRWTADGATITTVIESRTNPDGEPSKVSICSGPKVFTVISPEMLVGADTREFRAMPERD